MLCTRTAKKSFSPKVENLEGRDLMTVASASILAGGVLSIFTDNANNNISITAYNPVLQAAPKAPGAMASFAGANSLGQAAPTKLSTAASVPSAIGVGGIININNTITVRDLSSPAGHAWSFASSAVKSIRIQTGSGNDTIVSTVAVPTTVYAGNGNNHVETGAANDIVYLGNGNNTVFTNDGSDIVFGGMGVDYIDGGNGNDILHGGNGAADYIFGGLGNDTITGSTKGTGSELFGGAGNDTIFSSNINDFVDGGADYDTMTVKAGTLAVRNGDNMTITVPLGASNMIDKASPVTSGYRFLRAYGFNPTKGVILNDGTLGLSPANLTKLLQSYKPDVTMETGGNAPRLGEILSKGQPVIVPVQFNGHYRYVVVNGYDYTSQSFKYVDIDGVQKSIGYINLAFAMYASGTGYALIY